jgi:hypothetical protein
MRNSAHSVIMREAAACSRMKPKPVLHIQRHPHMADTWCGEEAGNEYWITLRRSERGPVWAASVLVVPKSDQKPYWRTLRDEQRFARAVRAFENSK